MQIKSHFLQFFRLGVNFIYHKKGLLLVLLDLDPTNLKNADPDPDPREETNPDPKKKSGSEMPEAQKRYSFTKVFHGLILNGTSRAHTHSSG